MKNAKCDNKCAHGCSENQSLVRVVDKNLKSMILVLCNKALNEYSDCKITNLSVKTEDQKVA